MGEAVYCDNQVVGTVTSAGYGYTVDQPLAITFIRSDININAQHQYEVSVLGKKFQLLFVIKYLMMRTMKKLNVGNKITKTSQTIMLVPEAGLEPARF